MAAAVETPILSCAQVLAVAQADAETAYRDLSRHRIEIRLEDDGWHIEYTFRGTGRFHVGGGPHYIIDSHTGEIVSKKYYQ